MIERIYIPTVNRVNNQILYNSLSDSLKEKVIFVVQSWEADHYPYDAEYLVLPDWLTTDHPKNISETRNIIYQHGLDTRYAMLDDDLMFVRRNAKYFGRESNMPKAKRVATPEDIEEMFAKMASYLNIPDVVLAGCGLEAFAPPRHEHEEIKMVTGAYFIDGVLMRDHYHDWDLTLTRTSEDILLNLYIATSGLKTVRSNEFVYRNKSVSDKEKLISSVWDNYNGESTVRDQELIESMFPSYYILDKSSEAKYRGKSLPKKLKLKKAYIDSITPTLNSLFGD